MNPIILLPLLSLFTHILEVEPANPVLPGKPRIPNSHITVMGFVYCDICSNNSFSRHSYFLSGDKSHYPIVRFQYCNLWWNFKMHVFWYWERKKSLHILFPILSPGTEVKIDCIFKALSAKTKEQITVSVNRTTDKYGMYKLEIPSVDGVRCAEDPDVASSCQASLMGSSSTSCNVPGYKSTSSEITVKARRENVCIYSLNPLNYRPSKRDISLCGN